MGLRTRSTVRREIHRPAAAFVVNESTKKAGSSTFGFEPVAEELNEGKRINAPCFYRTMARKSAGHFICAGISASRSPPVSLQSHCLSW